MPCLVLACFAVPEGVRPRGPAILQCLGEKRSPGKKSWAGRFGARRRPGGAGVGRGGCYRWTSSSAMMNRRSSAPELSSPTGVEVDPELAVLPRPPQKERTVSLALMMLTASLAVILGAALLADVRYALSSAEPRDTGELASLIPGPSVGNRFVRGQGALDIAAA